MHKGAKRFNRVKTNNAIEAVEIAINKVNSLNKKYFEYSKNKLDECTRAQISISFIFYILKSEQTSHMSFLRFELS